MTPFAFDHVFRAPSVAAVFAAYFDPEQQLEQDRQLEINERTVLEMVETTDEVRRVSRVVPRRQAPAFIRPFLSGPLHYIETVRWRKSDDQMTIETTLLGGRAVSSAVYSLSRVGPGLVRRGYTGNVSVNVALVSARIERGIIAEFARSMPITGAAVQAWLERSEATCSARA